MSEAKNPQDLYNRTYQLEQELLTLKEDIGELKNEFVFHKEYNVGGLDKETVKKVMKAAKAKAAQDNLIEKIEELEELQEIQETYS